jgi:hypothetical protein
MHVAAGSGGMARHEVIGSSSSSARYARARHRTPCLFIDRLILRAVSIWRFLIFGVYISDDGDIMPIFLSRTHR